MGLVNGQHGGRGGGVLPMIIFGVEYEVVA